MTSSSGPNGVLGEITPRPAETALRRLYDAHGSFLLSHLLRLTRGDRDKAEDILHETFVRAWRHLDTRSADGEWCRPWLIAVARRIALEHMRTERVRPGECAGQLPARADETNRLTDIGEVHTALKALPDQLRNVMIEVYIRDRSVSEAAEILAIPAETVKSLTFYALKALRDVLEDMGFTLPH